MKSAWEMRNDGEVKPVSILFNTSFRYGIYAMIDHLIVCVSKHGFFCSVNYLSGGGVNTNHIATRPPSDSRLLKNSEGICDGERNFCPYI